MEVSDGFVFYSNGRTFEVCIVSSNSQEKGLTPILVFQDWNMC